jgi:exonuclease III
MKIIEWNSQGAFRKKHEAILSQKPDILIITECECEGKLQFDKLTPRPNDFIWYGDSPNKGIGIFSYSDYNLEILPSFNPNYRYILPIKVSNPNGSFLLFAIWAMDNKEFPEARYIGQIWLALNYYVELLHLPIILTGDFNSNKIWDEKDRVGNHSAMVNLLKKKNIHSIYHSQEGKEQGKEAHPTFYMYRKQEKPYHIDYFFVSKKLNKKGTKLSVGLYEKWSHLSDHVPLILDISNPTDTFENKILFSHLINSLLDKLSQETKNRFKDVIKVIKQQAILLNNFEQFNSNIEKRKQLTKKIDRLYNINRLIEKL